MSAFLANELSWFLWGAFEVGVNRQLHYDAPCIIKTNYAFCMHLLYLMRTNLWPPIKGGGDTWWISLWTGVWGLGKQWIHANQTKCNVHYNNAWLWSPVHLCYPFHNINGNDFLRNWMGCCAAYRYWSKRLSWKNCLKESIWSRYLKTTNRDVPLAPFMIQPRLMLQQWWSDMPVIHHGQIPLISEHW